MQPTVVERQDKALQCRYNDTAFWVHGLGAWLPSLAPVSYHHNRSRENRDWSCTHPHWFHSGGQWSPGDSDSGNPEGNGPDPTPPHRLHRSRRDYWPHRVRTHNCDLQRGKKEKPKTKRHEGVASSRQRRVRYNRTVCQGILKIKAGLYVSLDGSLCRITCCERETAQQKTTQLFPLSLTAFGYNHCHFKNRILLIILLCRFIVNQTKYSGCYFRWWQERNNSFGFWCCYRTWKITVTEQFHPRSD